MYSDFFDVFIRLDYKMIVIPKGYIEAALEYLVSSESDDGSEIQVIRDAIDASDDQLVDLAYLYKSIDLANKRTLNPGLVLARYLPLTSHGPLSTCIMAADNLNQIVDVLERYTPSRLELFMVSVQRTESSLFLYYTPKPDIVEHWSALEECIFASIYCGIEFLFGVDAFPIRMGLTQAKPADLTNYAYFDGTSISFSNDQFFIEFSSSSLNEKVRYRNSELYSLSKKLCDDVLAKYENSHSTKERTYEVLSLSDKLLSLQEVALSIGLSDRALRNRLQQEDTNFQKINRQVKLDKAIFLLTNSNHSIQVISEKMGYQDVANFSAAFKKWCGSSPITLRNRNE